MAESAGRIHQLPTCGYMEDVLLVGVETPLQDVDTFAIHFSTAPTISSTISIR
jgi:hypothetical protein